ncbi:MAG: 1,6-anhydro-N-acetylmuramyl-L-alanine amidase AmpD [Rubrivivax sp.]|nr:1,6-anhydro-N-acetylmuramyl-L-alanine amidase AmpD [Rubrivivax sp.]MCL4696486.1 1,6-anhydro-N-acetylmuramyl-L-alanine amidase AmpD [Burkholderiaceae bacterium]
MTRRWHEGWWPPARRIESPNHGPRPPGLAITLVVLHSISLPPGRYGGDAVQRLFTNTLDASSHPAFAGLEGLRVSAHFFIRRDGRCEQYVSCDRRAWHAGVSSWRGRSGCNDWSIGIELEGLEGRRFDARQYERLAQLLRALSLRYPLDEVAGHEHVAPGRKHDPGVGFDWPRLARMLRRRRPVLVPFVPDVTTSE